MLRASSTLDRWGAAARKLCAPAAVFAAVWTLCSVPGARLDGARGWAMVAQAAIPAIFTVALLLPLVAAIGASRVAGRARTLGLLAVALLVAGLANDWSNSFLMAIGVWPAPPWSSPVLWWANFGEVAIVCIGAVLVEDHRARSKARSAKLREARRRAADVVRRTAEARLQATQARVDPRFLFDALSAVERIHDADAAAGQRLLDDLVTYLRAVVPDLDRVRSTLAREIEIARLWLGIRRQVLGGREDDAIDGFELEAGARWFPSTALRTLADELLASAPAGAALAIDVRCERAATIVHATTSDGAVDEGALAALRGNLRELYGDAVRLAVDTARRGATLEVDHEESASGHR